MRSIRIYGPTELLNKALIPKRRLVTRGGKTFLTTVYVGSTKEERKQQQSRRAVTKPMKQGKKRTRSTVELMKDQRKAIDFAPTEKQAVDKVLAFQDSYYEGHDEPSLYDAVNAATEEVKYALEQSEDSGKGWYKESMDHCRSILTTKYPDLAGDIEWDFFLSALATLSPETIPRHNLGAAVTMYDHYKKTGEISILNPKTEEAYGRASTQSMTEFKNLFNSFNSKAEFVKFMNGVSTVGELKSNYGKDVTGYGVYITGKQDEAAFNSMVLGEKIGQFYQSLRSTEGAVAVDRWAIRAYYRWMGHLEEGTVSTGEAGKSGRGILDRMTGADRKNVEYVMQTVGDKLGLDSAQVQAVMWYYEKRLYNKLGITGIGRSEDFGDAAEELYMEKSMSSEEFRVQIGSLMKTGNMPTFRGVLEAVMAIKKEN